MLLITANGINKPRTSSGIGQLPGFTARRSHPQLNKISVDGATLGQRVDTNFCANLFYICLVKPSSSSISLSFQENVTLSAFLRGFL